MAGKGKTRKAIHVIVATGAAATLLASLALCGCVSAELPARTTDDTKAIQNQGRSDEERNANTVDNMEENTGIDNSIGTSAETNQSQKAQKQGTASCAGWTDEDNDGICDRCGSDANGCAGYIDADGDGVCDNRDSNANVNAKNGVAPRDGTGYQHGRNR